MKGKKTFIPAEKVDTVETTDAGDASIGYFTAEVTSGAVFNEPLVIANKINLYDLS